jgi:phosphopantetheinyl transferase
MMFGQSHGELSALCAAGVLEYRKILPLHWEVDYEPEEFIKGNGRLALVGTSEEFLVPLLERYQDVIIAIYVAPNFQILGGEGSQLEGLIDELRWTQFLPYPAIHTHHFASLQPSVTEHLRSLPTHPFRTPVYSAMICDVYPEDPKAVSEILSANLINPVLLWQTTRKMYEDGARIFLQVGGGATMYAQARSNIGEDDVVAASLDVDYRSAITQLNYFCATLLTNGVNVNLAHLYENRSVKLLSIDFNDARLAKFELASAADISTLASTDQTHQNNDESERSFQEDTVPVDEPRMPFIGNVLSYVENQEVVIERLLDLREDLFLAHHLFVHAEKVKPVSACFPVVPLTISIEMMGEVAACLAPGCGLLGFEDIKATRWIGLQDIEILPLRISAKLQRYDLNTDTYRIHVCVYMEEYETPAIQATVLFGRHYLVDLNMSFSPLKNPRAHPLSAKQVYGERVLFHGPIFQSISGDTVLADRAVIGELAVLPKNGMFYSIRQPELLTDPILLDGVGHLIGLWAIERGVYVFPVAIRKLELYCPTPRVGTRVPVHVEISQFSSKLLGVDVEIQDGSGHVWMRIKGWWDWVFSWTQKVNHFRRHPTRHLVSHELDLEALPQGAIAQYIEKLDLKNTDQGINLEIISRLYLHIKEMPTFMKLEKVPARQLQWLLGRIAAKDAVRRWLARDTDKEMLHPASFIIENDESGQPAVKAIHGTQTPPSLSISHAEDRAVALVHDDAVGIDIERVADRDEVFLATIASQGERELLGNLVGSEPSAWITRLWCAKEATGKLLGTGLDAAPQGFEAIDIKACGTITILHHGNGRSVLVNTKQEDDFIIAYTAEMPARGEVLPLLRSFDTNVKD